MNFGTQVCTTREQSERLLAMGVKKETGDMFLTKCFVGNNGTPMLFIGCEYNSSTVHYSKDDIPAWSLHRLMKLCPDNIHLEDYPDTLYYLTNDPYMVTYEREDMDTLKRCEKGNVYDRMVDMIEWLINNKYFNKEYLEEAR